MGMNISKANNNVLAGTDGKDDIRIFRNDKGRLMANVNGQDVRINNKAAKNLTVDLKGGADRLTIDESAQGLNLSVKGASGRKRIRNEIDGTKIDVGEGAISNTGDSASIRGGSKRLVVDNQSNNTDIEAGGGGVDVRSRGDLNSIWGSTGRDTFDVRGTGNEIDTNGGHDAVDVKGLGNRVTGAPHQDACHAPDWSQLGKMGCEQLDGMQDCQSACHQPAGFPQLPWGSMAPLAFALGFGTGFQTGFFTGLGLKQFSGR